MATKLSAKDQIAFSEGLANYVYINEQGRLDLEDFCVTLASCIYHDGIGLEKRARPEYFHRLLLEIIDEGSSDESSKNWVQSQNLVDWTPAFAHLYPNKSRTCIHVAALTMHMADWISLIGSEIFEIPNDEWRPEYFGWAKEEWQFTHMFLAGFHDQYYSFTKKLDLKISMRGETSSFETLQLSKRLDISYDEAKSRLEHRNNAWNIAISRIEKSIEDGYFLESITLSENLISNLLFNFLSAKVKVNDDLSFNALIQKARPYFKTSEEILLINNVDGWRKNRNDAIHKFIVSSINDLAKNSSTFNDTSMLTAIEGLNIMKKILQWYKSEAVEFIPHNFPRKNINS